MTEKFIKWFFSEVDMYGPDMRCGIFGDYIVDKILGKPFSSIDLFVYSRSDQWNNIKDSFVKHIENVWNIFQNHKIRIQKYENLYYIFNIHNVCFRIFWEKPYNRSMFTFQTLQYVWENKKFALVQTSNNADPLCLLKTLNNVKRRKLIPLYPNKLILDHNYFIADRDYYIAMVDLAYYLILNQEWYFDPRFIRLHICYDQSQECSICKNEMNVKLKLQCGHSFHKECLKELMSIEPEQKHASICPNCRSPIQIFFT